MSTRLQIVTPEGRVFSDQVDLVVVPGSEGELGVLSAHAALVTALKPGELRYVKDGKEHILAVGSGLLEVTANSVAVLSDLAVNEADIDEHAVEKALEAARKALEERPDGAHPEDIVGLQLAIQKSMAQLDVKRRRKRL
ncbi:MAG: ATP synthase F1 subunit epsilon [Verrucomicrobiales bacterium]